MVRRIIKTTFLFQDKSSLDKKAKFFIKKGHAVYTKKTKEGYKLFTTKKPLKF